MSTYAKNYIFERYRKARGFDLNPANRSNYKVDHYIPLCAGGSNNVDNLWPQHVSTYSVTDPIDDLGCKRLSQGKITQEKVIQLIKKAKENPFESEHILKHLRVL